MAIVKMKELRDMSEQDLNNKLNDLRLELAKDKGKVKVGGTADNPGKIRAMKKAVAKILTLKHQRTTAVKTAGSSK